MIFNFLVGAAAGLFIVISDHYVRRVFQTVRRRSWDGAALAMQTAPTLEDLERRKSVWRAYSNYMYKMDLRLETAFYLTQWLIGFMVICAWLG